MATVPCKHRISNIQDATISWTMDKEGNYSDQPFIDECHDSMWRCLDCNEEWYTEEDAMAALAVQE